MTTLRTDFDSGHASILGRLIDWPRRVAARAALRRLYRTTVKDLATLDDEMLRDIGLTRDQIREVAAEDAARIARELRVPFAPLF